MRILVTSSKGGIGKSTICIGLALAFINAGRRVLLVDCDLGGRCLDIMMGEEDRVLFDIGDVSAGRAAPSAALLHPWELENLFFCPAPAVFSPSDTDGNKLITALERLAVECGADHVICDTAEMSAALRIAEGFADFALIAATQQPASVRAAGAVSAALSGAGLKNARLVINMFDYKSARRGSRLGILDMIDGSGLRLSGIVPYDRALMMAGESASLPDQDSPGMRAFSNIAARLEGGYVRLLSGISGISAGRAL